MAAYVQDSFASQIEVKLQYSNGVVEVLGLFSSSHNLFLAIVYRQPDDRAGGNRSTLTLPGAGGMYYIHAPYFV